jgi:hypothetical protein
MPVTADRDLGPSTRPARNVAAGAGVPVGLAVRARRSKLSEPDKQQPYGVFVGLDVGKGEHHGCALDPAGRRLYDKPLPNDETALRGVLTDLAAHGQVLLVVDQPASIGALAIAVARDIGIDVAYLPGLAMRRIADLHPGQSKTDARDAQRHRRRGTHHAAHVAPCRQRR